MQKQFDLQRFLDAQAKVYADVCDELRRGKKRSHWMWFVFPQIKGLGHSETARHLRLIHWQRHKHFWYIPSLGIA